MCVGQSGKDQHKKVMILVSMCLFIAISGDCVYNSGNFEMTQNPEKLDAGVKEVGDIILKHCDHPKCVMQKKYLSQIRQYSPDIILLYGRNAYNYITGADRSHRIMATEMENRKPDYPMILNCFKESNCDIIVTNSNFPYPKWA